MSGTEVEVAPFERDDFAHAQSGFPGAQDGGEPHGVGSGGGEQSSVFVEVSPNIVQRRLLRIPAPQAAQVLQGMANQDAQTLAVQLQAIMLWAPSQMRRLRRIWQWLPTYYEREMDGDNWQYTA